MNTTETPRRILTDALQRFCASPDAVNALFAKYGSLGDIVSADRGELVRSTGLSEEAADFIGCLKPVASELAKEGALGRCAISSWSALVNFCRVRLAHERRELVLCLFLDRRNRLISEKEMSRGTIDHAPVYPREIAKAAIMEDAAAVIIVHNHPSGDPTPSQADIEMTKTIRDILRSLEITLHDHLIIGREGQTSLKSLGLM